MPVKNGAGLGGHIKGCVPKTLVHPTIKSAGKLTYLTGHICFATPN